MRRPGGLRALLIAHFRAMAGASPAHIGPQHVRTHEGPCHTIIAHLPLTEDQHRGVVLVASGYSGQWHQYPPGGCLDPGTRLCRRLRNEDFLARDGDKLATGLR